MVEFSQRVYLTAAIIANRAPREHREDARQALLMAATKAMPAYDADRGASVETFLEHRMRGAVRDFLRGCDELSRRHRQRVKLGLADAPRRVPARNASLVADEGRGPAELAAGREAWNLLRFCGLREARALLLYYGSEMTLEEVGEAMGLSTSMASQLRERALRQIREAIGVEV